MASKPRGFETVRDMVLSMAVVGAVVVALFLVVVWQRPEVQGSIRPAVDVAGVVDQVELTAPFPVQRPADLPDSWSPTSAWYDPSSQTGELGGGLLHIGYQTTAGEYAEVKQSDGDVTVAIREYADAGEPVGTFRHDGAVWQRLESASSGERALVAENDTRDRAPVVLVTGTADWAELEELATSLSP